MIKNIHCFGTSFTAGGGFEFGSLHENKNKLLLDFYSKYDEPLTQFNFSWPGQLQKYIYEDGKSIKVHNHAKNGYGNELLYRKIFDLVFSESFKLDESLFLIEFSHIGRWEFFSNSLNDYVIFNYQIDDLKNSDNWDIAHTYAYDNDKTKQILHKMKENSFDFFKEVINVNEISKKIINNNIMLLSFLELNKINYMITCPPAHIFDKKGNFLMKKINILDKIFNFEDYIDFINYFLKKNMTITDETGGKINNPHAGYFGNKQISRIIHEQLKLKNYGI